MAIQNPVPTVRPTATRVEENTAQRANARIRRTAEEKVAQAVGEPEGIDRRLQELDREWNIERVLQTNFGVVNLLSITLGALVARPFFAIAGVAAGFMVEHALKGWCPPVPVFRRLGFRTSREISQERYALKALRGDFKKITKERPGEAFDIANTLT